MKVRPRAIVAATFGIALVFALVQMSKRDQELTHLNSPALHSEGARTTKITPEVTSLPIQELAEIRPQPATLESPEPSAQGKTNTPKTAPAKPPRPKKLLKHPLAREALSLVGLDPDAEAYWYAAINDPTIGAEERKDLIEDLNEDGLSDPKHPTNEDLPLIINRIQLIELFGPSAMDEVNWDAFQEAYKDLLNLAELALGGGERFR